MSKRVAFNYDVLIDTKARAEARKHADRIAKLLKASGEGVVEIGRCLATVRETITPAMFRAWVEHEFHWVPSTAFSYMQASRLFGDLDCVGKFQPAAITMLARKNVPPKVVEAMIAKARLGEVITYVVALAAIKADQDFKPTRRDAGVARNPASSRLVPEQAPLTVDALQKSLDRFSANLTSIALEQRDREALANRFFELAVQLRTVQPQASTGPAPSAKAESGKSRSTTKTAKSARA